MKFAIALLLCSLAYGCSRTATDAPPVVHYGRDECAGCGMIVSDERYACALRVTIDGETRDLIFDDIGDMLDYQREKGGAMQVARCYVHDFESKRWIDGSTAAFVKSDDVHSPMGSGIVAASDRTAAESLQAKLGGKVLSYADISAKGELAAK